MIDGDADGEEYDKIGEVNTTMGELVGAKNQVWEAKLSKKAKGKKNSGTIIVRSEILNVSNMVTDFSTRLENVNNKTSDCLGMCGSPFVYTLEI